MEGGRVRSSRCYAQRLEAIGRADHVRGTADSSQRAGPEVEGLGRGARRCALTADCEIAEASGNERQLGWYAAGQHIALDVARGLHFLHKAGVRCSPRSSACRPAVTLGALRAVRQK